MEAYPAIDYEKNRVFIDCSFIDFSRQPTGIPRVVIKYLQEGFKWGLSQGKLVVPVIPTEAGLHIVRPTPVWLTKTHAKSIDKFTNAQKTIFFQKNQQEDILKTKSSVDYLGSIYLEEGDILFCPSYWHDISPSIYRALSSKGLLIVTLIHDLLPITFEKCYNEPWRFDFKTNAIAALSYSDVVLTVSHYTLNVAKELARRNGIDMPPCAVAYNGYEPLHLEVESSYLNNNGLNRVLDQNIAPYLMVGSIEPKKNHRAIIEVFEDLWKNGFERPLIIIGRRGWLDAPIVYAITSSEYYKHKLFWFDKLDDSDLAKCYSECHALIFASLGEGFGIPMIEAASFGKPVIVYDTEISREILGDYGEYFDNTYGFIDRLAELERYEYYRDVLKKSELFKWPKWSDLGSEAFNTMVKLIKS